MTDDKKEKPKFKSNKQYIQEAQDRLKKTNKSQNFNKTQNFRPQGRGR